MCEKEERARARILCPSKARVALARSFSCRDRIVVPLPASFPSVPSRFPAKAPWHRSHRVIITRHRVTIVVIPAEGSHSRKARRVDRQ